MTELRTLSDVTLTAVLEDNDYITRSPHDAAITDDGLVITVGHGKGWMVFTKEDGVWMYKTYLGERGDTSNGLFYDVLDQEWLSVSDARRRDGNLSEHELLRALGLETDDEEKSEAALALYVAHEWLQENMWSADTIVTYISTLNRIPSLRLEQAGWMCQFQAEGTLDGYPFYFRYRGGVMMLRVGGLGESEDLFFKPLYSASMSYGDEYGGSLSPEAFETVFTKLVKELERSPIWWDFAGNFTQEHLRDKKGDPSKMGAWGNTAEEAWESLHARVSEDVSLEVWQKYLDIYGTRFEPITVDDRKFPETDPDFTVLD